MVKESLLIQPFALSILRSDLEMSNEMSPTLQAINESPQKWAVAPSHPICPEASGGEHPDSPERLGEGVNSFGAYALTQRVYVWRLTN